MYYADKRQQFLVDQGYYFEVIEELPFMRNPKEKEKLFLSSSKEQRDFLQEILVNDETKLEKEEEESEDLEEDEDQKGMENYRRERTMKAFTGADGG